MERAIKSITRTFPRKLGGQLEAIYRFSAGPHGYTQTERAEVNLLIVVADGTNIHALRNLFWPVWQQYSEVLHRAPLVAHQSAFARHLTVNPLLGHYLAHEGQQLFGAPDMLDPYLAPVEPHVTCAHLAAQAMQASVALVPDLVDPETAAASSTQLRLLLQHMQNEAPLDSETDVQIFARLQQILASMVVRLPAPAPRPPVKAPAATSPLLPGLQAIYKEGNKMVLVFTQLTPQQIVSIDWQTLSERLVGQSNGLAITSVEQLSLILTYENPLDLLLRRYRHNWGPDFLPLLAVSPRHILRHAARLPSHILVDALPNAYLTMPAGSDEAMHKLIHDFQNRMLNIRLENELLSRIQGLERFTPPTPIPGRDSPPQHRLEAIFQHLDWWTEYYTEHMAKATP